LILSSRSSWCWRDRARRRAASGRPKRPADRLSAAYRGLAQPALANPRPQCPSPRPPERRPPARPPPPGLDEALVVLGDVLVRELVEDHAQRRRRQRICEVDLAEHVELDLAAVLVERRVLDDAVDGRVLAHDGDAQLDAEQLEGQPAHEIGKT